MASAATTTERQSSTVPQYEILAADPEIARRKQSADDENTPATRQQVSARQDVRSEDTNLSSNTHEGSRPSPAQDKPSGESISHDDIKPRSGQERSVGEHSDHDGTTPASEQEKTVGKQNSHENTRQPQQRMNEQRDRLPDTYFDDSLFQSDNTGTRKFRNLMRGLKNIIIRQYDPTESPDLMPRQLASYYEDLNGDYNQLFHKTPNPSIAFIYKSLGCSYSLQPLPNAEKVEEPEVPALKTEGWIMWSTIQMLLGPDEHAGFLMEAVKRWDVIDPETGKLFPRTLPRECLPATADQRMSDWYEGVSERLDKEVEEVAALRERQQALQQHVESRRVATKQDDDEHSVDSRGPALAYFRNPLYRHVDGRPSIVRNGSKRPPLSPRHSIIDKGKGAVTTVGHVIRNVTSPHLWDGNGKDRRRRSVPDSRYQNPGDRPPSGGPREDRLLGSGRQGSPRQHRRVGSSSGDSERRTSAHGSQSSQHGRPRRDDRDFALRHSRSHDPTPSEREADDYFQQSNSSSRHGQDSAQEEKAPAFGPSFAPSPGLPFAAKVARQQAEYDHSPRRSTSGRGGHAPNMSIDRRAGHVASGSDAAFPQNRPRSRYDDRPKHDSRPPQSHAPYDDRSQHDRPPHHDRPRHDDRHRNEDRGPRPEERRRHGDIRDKYDNPPDPKRLSGGQHRSSGPRRSHSSDVESAHSGAEDSDRRSNRKQTRFAPEPIAGVDGRRYVDHSPWQSQG